MSIEDEQSEVMAKYHLLKQRGGVPHSDLQHIDELVKEWGVAYDDEDNYSVEQLRDKLGEIESIIDDINDDLDEDLKLNLPS